MSQLASPLLDAPNPAPVSAVPDPRLVEAATRHMPDGAGRLTPEQIAAMVQVTTTCGADHGAGRLTTTPDVGPSILTTQTEAPALPVNRTPVFRYQVCEHNLVRGWPERCSPVYDPDSPDHQEMCSSGAAARPGTTRFGRTRSWSRRRFLCWVLRRLLIDDSL